MKISLTTKTALLVSIPIAAFILSSLILNHGYDLQLKAANIAHSNLEILETTSNLIHELEFERTLSILNILELTASNELENQRRKSDGAVAQFESIQTRLVSHAKTLGTSSQSFNTLSTTLSTVRTLLNNKGQRSDISNGFNQLIDSLIKLEIAVTETPSPTSPTTSAMGIRHNQGLIHFEVAKEQISRLAPEMITLLRNHKLIDDSTLFAVIDLMSNSISLLHSPLSISTDEITTGIHNLESSTQWKKLEQVFKDIVRKSGDGNYVSDPSTVISSSFRIVSDIKSLLDKEIELLRVETQEKKSEAVSAIWTVRLSFLFTLVILGLLSWLTSHSIINPIRQAVVPLRKSAIEVDRSAEELQTSSTHLSRETAQAATSLQELASGLIELSNKVCVTTLNSSQCNEKTVIGYSSAIRGKQTVAKMIQTIHDIDASNETLLTQVNEGSEQLLEITKVIREIGVKTKVINEIVFQTKLLSFNAAVEAARAGEHGKGFAIVAEEVGKLAQMSGNAAKEIGEMLEGSTRQVDKIIRESRSKSHSLMALGKEKVQSGTEVSQQCGVIIDEIVANFGHVNETMSLISTASQEHSHGLSVFTQTISQLDQAMHRNSLETVTLNTAAKALLENAKNVLSISKNLTQTTQGNFNKTKRSASFIKLRTNT